MSSCCSGSRSLSCFAASFASLTVQFTFKFVKGNVLSLAQLPFSLSNHLLFFGSEGIFWVRALLGSNDYSTFGFSPSPEFTDGHRGSLPERLRRAYLLLVWIGSNLRKENGLRMTSCASLRGHLDSGPPHIHSRLSRDRRLKFRVRSSPTPVAVDAQPAHLSARQAPEPGLPRTVSPTATPP